MTEYEKGYKDGMAGAALPNIIDNGDKIDGYAYSYKTDSDGVPYINIDCVRAMLTKAADHRQLAEWLMELKELREKYREVVMEGETLNADYTEQVALNEQYKKREEQYKRLLKAAVEDLSCGGKNNKCTKSCKTCTHSSIKGYGCRYYGEYHWRYADEALKLFGGSENG